jgi:hypothetical protein
VHDHTVQVLIDADNLDVPRLRLLVAALEATPPGNVVIAGAPTALEAVDWPVQAQVLPAGGGQNLSLDGPVDRCYWPPVTGISLNWHDATPA